MNIREKIGTTGLAVALAGSVLIAAGPAWAEPASEKEKGTSNEPGGGSLDLIETVVVRGRRGEGPLPLDKKVATGSRLDIPAIELPASVSVISRDLIRERGARTALEAVENAVGMTGGIGVGSIPAYATRGFTGNDISVMRDGVRQNTNSQSARPLDSFLFERIEILKGPASLLHGEGAVGGAVNYVSKAPSESLQGEALLSAGFWDSYRLGLGLGGPTSIDNLLFRADISRSQAGGYVEDSAEVYDAFGGSLFWQAADNTRITLSGTYLKDDVKSYYGTPVIYDGVIGLDGQEEVRPADTGTDRLINPRIAENTRRLNYNNLDNFARGENGFARLIIETGIGQNWRLRNELYAAKQKLDWRNTESTVWNPETELVDRSSFFLIYRDDLQLGNRLDLSWRGDIMGRPNQFLVGVVYDKNDQLRNSGQDYPNSPIPETVTLRDFDRGYGPDASPEKTAQIITKTTALYMEDVLDITNHLKLVGGLRLDHIDLERRSFLGAPDYTKSYSPLTGRLGAVYAVASQTNVYASYSHAAQPVSQLVSLSAAQDEFSLQKGVQYEVGIKGTTWNNQLDVTFALFDIEKNDILTSEVINNERINSQIGAQVSQGAELALSFNLPRDWRIDANLAWTWKAEFEDFNENLGDEVISRTGNTPVNVSKKVAGLHITRDINNWQLEGSVRHVGERQANNNNGIQLDPYTTVDASIGYAWPAFTLTLRGRNLTDETYVPTASRGGLTQRLAEPRSAELSLHYHFGG